MNYLVKIFLAFFLCGAFLACQQGGFVLPSQASPAKTCKQIRAELDLVLKPHASTCQKDADCVCFDAGLSDSHPCGGVTNSEQFKQAQQLIKDIGQQQCGFDVDCAYWECKPSCEKGLCQTNGKY